MTNRPTGETSSLGCAVRSCLHREGVAGNARSTYSGGGGLRPLMYVGLRELLMMIYYCTYKYGATGTSAKRQTDRQTDRDRQRGRERQRQRHSEREQSLLCALGKSLKYVRGENFVCVSVSVCVRACVRACVYVCCLLYTSPSPRD